MANKLGDRVRDRISGVTGIVTGKSEYLFGCRRIGITPEANKDGEPAQVFWIDDEQAELVDAVALQGYMPQTSVAPPAGPRPDPINRRDAIR